MFALIPLLFWGGFQLHALPAPNGAMRVDSLGIQANDRTIWYSYTNKEAGFYFGEARGMNLAPYQGWTVFDNPVIKDYSISANGKSLDRRSAVVTVFPDRLTRIYGDSITETFTLLDSVNAFVVEIKCSKPSRIGFEVLFNSTQLKVTREVDGGPVLIENDAQTSFGAWVAVAAMNSGLYESQKTKNGLTSPLLVSIDNRDASFVVACGRQKADARRIAISALKDHVRMEASRRGRIQRILDKSLFSSSDSTFDKSLAWAKISMDALVTDQGMKGIWAGLPWFNDYWGRDSFISLAGATLWLGNFETARQILLDFAAKQDTDTTSASFGRIPNLITPKQTIYNTADGTPWFVHGVFSYYRWTSDRDFLLKVFPVVERAFEGTVKFHLDKNFFLVHGDQETWMDAVGPGRPYTPRGDRAVDIQWLWYRQLMETRFLSGRAGETKLRDLTENMAAVVLKNFNERFVDRENSLLYDHLHPDGALDSTYRPNQLFALPMISDGSLRARIIENVTRKLAYPWGIASLDQGDPNFHPFHHDEPYYVPDAAYHNGTVWLWLTGFFVSGLTSEGKQDFAFGSTRFLTKEILEGKTAGTLPELFDAFPREGKDSPDESGAFSQAWSLAEFITSVYQDYLGVRVNSPDDSIILRPRLPKSLGRVMFRIQNGNRQDFILKYNFLDSVKRIEIEPIQNDSKAIFDIAVDFPGDKLTRTGFILRGREKILLEFLADTVIATNDGKPFPVECSNITIPRDSALDSLHYQMPEVSLNWDFYKRPSFSVLSLKDVKRKNSSAKEFTRGDDPVGDDKGPGGEYTYPLNQNFQDGILDILHADIGFDSSDVYFRLKFRKLVNPMWHPEYGFQLTFAAIAIGDGTDGQNFVGRNSEDTLPRGRGYQKIIYIGGGLEIFDKTGKKLAAYVPSAADTSDPLGDVGSSEVSFSLPINLIGRPNKDWKVTILVGAQDDHGGGGVGEFRSVAEKASEWGGGGKRNGGKPNIYDVMTLR